MRKAQMEILGLSMVILLVIIGVLFAIVVMQQPEENLAETFKQKSLAVNYLNTLLSATSECGGASFRELVQDCSERSQIVCPGGNSCDYTKIQFEEIFKKTLVVQNRDYNLIVEGPGNVNTISSGFPCPGELEAGVQVVPTRVGSVKLLLQICG